MLRGAAFTLIALAYAATATLVVQWQGRRFRESDSIGPVLTSVEGTTSSGTKLESGPPEKVAQRDSLESPLIPTLPPAGSTGLAPPTPVSAPGPSIVLDQPTTLAAESSPARVVSEQPAETSTSDSTSKVVATKTPERVVSRAEQRRPISLPPAPLASTVKSLSDEDERLAGEAVHSLIMQLNPKSTNGDATQRARSLLNPLLKYRKRKEISYTVTVQIDCRQSI